METTAASSTWQIEQVAALLAVELLGDENYYPDDAKDLRTRKIQVFLSLETLVVMCHRARNRVRKQLCPKGETDSWRVKADNSETVRTPQATDSLLYLPCGCEDGLSISVVLKSIAVLVGADGLHEPPPAITAMHTEVYARDFAHQNRPQTIPFDDSDEIRHGQLLYRSPPSPWQSAGNMDGDNNPHIPSDQQQDRQPLPSLPPPPPVPPSTDAVSAGARCTDANIVSGSMGQLANEQDFSLPQMPTVNVVLPAGKVVGSLATQAEIYGLPRSNTRQASKESSTIDKDTSRRVLYERLLSLVLGLFENEEESPTERKGEELILQGEGGNKSHSSDAEERKDLVWDIVISILGDSWSEIRKMATAHAKSLVETLGPVEARALYLKAAARCNDSLLVPESDNNQPCQWKRMHGLLLGMRAAVEGAAASTATASLVFPAAGVTPETGITCRTTLLSSTPDKIPPIERSQDIREDSVAPKSSMQRDATLAEFVADVVAAGAHPPSSQPTPPPPLAAELSLATPPVQASAPATTAVKPRGMSTTARHYPPPVVNGVEVAFGCLSHRQAAVREAAVRLLHAQALTLGPRAAVALYRRTVKSLELERTQETSEEEEKATNGWSRSPRATPSCPLPEAVKFMKAAAGAAKTSAGCGVRGAARNRVRRDDAGVPSEPTPAGTRSRRDRVSGLLDLLQHLLGERGVLPHGTVGDTWERLFSVLRSYMGHPETALRQAAGAVLLQIASTTAPSRNTAGTVSFEDSSQFHHTSARIVLWALLRSSSRQQQLLVDGDTHPTAPTTTNNRDGAKLGSTDPSWKLGEGALLVYEGVLKSLVEGRMAQELSGHIIATKTSGQHSVEDSAIPSDERGTKADHSGWGWSEEMLHTTPPLGDLLVFLRQEAEDALHEAELLRLNAGHWYRRPHEAATSCSTQTGGGGDGVRNSTTTDKERTGKQQQQLQQERWQQVNGSRHGGGGSLELWRAGSQLLPSIARALLWWNPKAVLGACERASPTVNRMMAGAEVDTESTSAAGVIMKGETPLEPLSRGCLTLLRRRTCLSVACEILRAAVRHARHLAELSTDRGHDDGANEHHVTNGISIVTRERWGGSTDGIADTSGGLAPALVRELSATYNGKVAEDAEAAIGNTALGADSEAATAEVKLGGRSPKASESVLAQIVLDALSLARDASPLLARALATFSAEGEVLPKGVRKTSCESTQDCEAVTAETFTSSGDCLTTPHPVATASSPSARTTALEQHYRQQYVWTGGIEALILMESFLATTIFRPHCSKTPTSQEGDGTSRTSGDERGFVEEPSALSSLSSSSSSSVLADGACSGVLPPSAGGTKACSTAATEPDWQVNYNAAGGGSGGCRDDDPSPFWLIQQQLELLHHEAFPTAAGSTGKASSSAMPVEATTTSLVIPFSWGSLSLLHSPTAFAEKRGGASGGDMFGAGQLQDHHSQRRAARLDRLLSARVVRAVPGYVCGLPPQRCIGIIPSLLRWLEASDHNVRWISVSLLEAHTHLLSAMSIALKKSAIALRKRQVGHAKQQEHEEQRPGPERQRQEAEEEENFEMCDNDAVAPEALGGVDQVAGAVVQTVKGMLSSDDSKGMAAKGLFPQTCVVARDVINLLIVLVQDLRAPRSPTHADTQNCFVGGSDPLRDRAAYATPIEMEKRSEMVASVLRSVAEHLLRWYPEHEAVEVGKHQHQNQPCVREGGVEDVRCSGGVRVVVDGVVGDERIDGCGGVGSDVGGGDDDDGDSSGSGGNWDDWDDDVQDDGAGGRRTTDTDETKVSESRLFGALHSASEVLRSAGAYYVAAAAYPVAATSQDASYCSVSTPVLGASSEELGTLEGRGGHLVGKQRTAAPKLRICSSEKYQGNGRRPPEKSQWHHQAVEAAGAVVNEEIHGASDSHTGYAVLQEKHGGSDGQERTSAKTADRGSSNTGLRSVPQSLVEVLGRLSQEHHQALLRAWRFGAESTPAGRT
ncbi:unnamed protein product, partial [Ectocarpus sp. 6 AP-2014]